MTIESLFSTDIVRDLEALKESLKKNEFIRNINQKDDAGNALLHHAVANSRPRMVSALLAVNNANVNTQNLKGDTPLHCAIENKSMEIIKLLSQHKDIDITKENSEKITPFIKALRIDKECKRNDVLQILLSSGRNTASLKDADGNTPLHQAIIRHDNESAQLLLNCETTNLNEKNNKGQTPLITAAWENNNDIAKLLIGIEGVDINATDNSRNTPLHLAISIQYIDQVRLLLKKNSINVNLQDEDGNTPLLNAVLDTPDYGIVKMLIKFKGIDVNKATNRGGSPLGIAIANRDEAFVKLLLSHNKTDIEYRDADGHTPIFIAAICAADSHDDMPIQHDRMAMHVMQYENIIATLLLFGASVSNKCNVEMDDGQNHFLTLHQFMIMSPRNQLMTRATRTENSSIYKFSTDIIRMVKYCEKPLLEDIAALIDEDSFTCLVVLMNLIKNQYQNVKTSCSWEDHDKMNLQMVKTVFKKQTLPRGGVASNDESLPIMVYNIFERSLSTQMRFIGTLSLVNKSFKYATINFFHSLLQVAQINSGSVNNHLSRNHDVTHKRSFSQNHTEVATMDSKRRYTCSYEVTTFHKLLSMQKVMCNLLSFLYHPKLNFHDAVFLVLKNIIKETNDKVSASSEENAVSACHEDNAASACL